MVSVTLMIYEHPLAYLLGLEGIALLRSFTGEHDRVFVDSRIAEIRRLLDDESLANAAVEVARVGTTDGQPPNSPNCRTMIIWHFQLTEP